MNASIRGVLHTKADRVNERIDLCAGRFLNRYPETNKESFKEFVKSMHIIVTTELNEKGVERKWKESSQKSENLNNVCLQATTKERMSLLKTLMTKLRQWK